MYPLLRSFVAAVVFFVLLIPACAQESSMSLADYARKVQGQKSAPAGQPAQAPAADETLADRARDLQAKDLAKVKISPEQAQQVLKSVDTLMQFASEDSGLPIHTTVKRRMISRDDLVSTMEARKQNDEETNRLQAQELALKKFGYLPRVFSTSKFVQNMYAERIAGYYDFRTKEISLLSWIPPEEQFDVLTHELTHALQDQNFNLFAWERENISRKRGAGAFQVTASESLPESLARLSVVEGQATVVLIDHQLQQRGIGITLEHLPGASEALAQYMAMVLPDTPAIHSAPIFLRDAMLFPYREGLVFELDLLQKGGKSMAFNDVFAHPPVNTHQVLHSQAYLMKEKMHTPVIPEVGALLRDQYEIADSGGMGELDVRSLIKQLSGTRLADSISRGWRGGSYMVLKRKDVPTDQATTADVALMYVSDWDSLEIARRFARFYADGVARRYTQVSPIAVDCKGNDCPVENFQFNTEEGLITIECRSDNLVLITESLAPTVAGAVTAAMAKANSGPGSRKSAAAIMPDLSLRYAASPAFAGLRNTWAKEMIRELAAEALHIAGETH